MECLIPGLILVGLMIYASTRIKRASAGAYERETIETSAFIFEKSEEFLNKVEPAAGLELEGYSREFGSGDAASRRQATYEISRIAELPDDAKSGDTEIINEKRYHSFSIRRQEGEIEVIDHHRIAPSSGDFLHLKVKMLAEASDDVRRRVETILGGFVVK
jgi:hypothetical protein